MPGQEAKIPHASWPKTQNIKQKQYCNKLNKDFKNGPHPNKKILKKNTPKSISCQQPDLIITIVIIIIFSGNHQEAKD